METKSWLSVFAIALCIASTIGQKNQGGILSFASLDEFQKVVQDLEKSFNDWATRQGSRDSAEPSDDVLAKRSLDPQLSVPPLDDFETKLRFSSLRRKWIQEELDWLKRQTGETLPERASPVFMPEIIATLFNAYGEVMIGDTYYRATSDGQQEYKTLGALIKSRPLIPSQQSPNSPIGEGRLLQGGTNQCCSCNRKNTGWYQSGSRAIRWVVGHWCLPYWAFYLPSLKWAWASVLNYRRIWFFGWHWIIVPRWTTVSVYGTVSTWGTVNCIRIENLCLNELKFNPSGTSISAWTPFLIHLMFVSGWSKPGWIKGSHASAGLSTYFSSV